MSATVKKATPAEKKPISLQVKEFTHNLKWTSISDEGLKTPMQLVVFMSFGKVARLASIFTDLGDAVNSANNAAFLNLVAVESLLKVDLLTGGVEDVDKQFAYDVLDQLSVADGAEYANWVMGHIIDFLLDIQQKQMQMVEAKKEVMQTLMDQAVSLKVPVSSEDGTEN